MNWIFAIIALLIGVLIGVVVMIRINHSHTIGFLREDRSDPDSPYMFMELEQDGLSKIHRFQNVVLKVKLENYIQSNPK